MTTEVTPTSATCPLCKNGQVRVMTGDKKVGPTRVKKVVTAIMCIQGSVLGEYRSPCDYVQGSELYEALEKLFWEEERHRAKVEEIDRQSRYKMQIEDQDHNREKQIILDVIEAIRKKNNGE